MEKIYKKIFVDVIIRSSECLTKHICEKITEILPLKGGGGSERKNVVPEEEDSKACQVIFQAT